MWPSLWANNSRAGNKKGDIICHLLPFKTGSALEHPHFTFLPVPTETATLPPPQLGKSTAPVSRLDGCVPFCGLKLTSSCITQTPVPYFLI